MKDDLISRQAAIKTAHFPVMDDASYEVVRVDDILALPTAQPEWIPCGVAFPEKEGVYLVTDKTAYGEKISMRYWNIHEKDAFWSGYESDVVTAWMPLPTPYREGGQDGET